VSSPNEPGHPRAGDGPGGGNGSVPAGSSAGHAADHVEAPPWQRGPAARAARQQNRPQGSPARNESPRAGSAAGDTTGLDDRLNRFIGGGSGSSSPTRETDGPTRTERPEVYASELPDLSGPVPRPPQQRKPPPERPAQEAASRPAAPTSRIQVGTRHSGGPVRASMQIRRIDPWSALKVSLVLSVALFFVWMIAVAFLYLVLGGMGVWSKLNSNVGDLLTSAGGQTGGELVSSGTIFGGAALIGLVNIVLLTAMATVGAFIYNLTTDLVGGLEVTLADRD
jgi:hypothetical protein